MLEIYKVQEKELRKTTKMEFKFWQRTPVYSVLINKKIAFLTNASF